MESLDAAFAEAQEAEAATEEDDDLASSDPEPAGPDASDRSEIDQLSLDVDPSEMAKWDCNGGVCCRDCDWNICCCVWDGEQWEC